VRGVQQEVVAAERQLKELTAQEEACAHLESENRRIRGRLAALRKANAAREQALHEEIRIRREELHRVKKKTEVLEANSNIDAAVPFPALTTAEPLGESLSSALKELSKWTATTSKLVGKKEEVSDLDKPAVWPQLSLLGDLWLSQAELEAAVNWRISARRYRGIGDIGAHVKPLDGSALSPVDCAQELVHMSSPEVTHSLIREHNSWQAALEIDTRSTRDRLTSVMDSLPAFHSSLGTQELKLSEALQRQKGLLSAITVAEKTMRDKAEQGGKQLKLPKNQTEEIVKWLKNMRLHSEEVRQDFPDSWKAIMQRQRFRLHSQRVSCEKLRRSASGAIAASERPSKNPKTAVVDEHSRAMMKSVQKKAQEALKATEAYAAWAAGAEASLVASALVDERWSGIAASQPQPDEDAAKTLRRALGGLLRVVSGKPPEPGHQRYGTQEPSPDEMQPREHDATDVCLHEDGNEDMEGGHAGSLDMFASGHTDLLEEEV